MSSDYQNTFKKSNETIDKDKIIKTAFALLNKEGISGLTMRKLADSLEIQAASLYWHIKNKAELLHIMADSIAKEINFPESNLFWTDKLIAMAHQYRQNLLHYRDSAQIMAETLPFTFHRLRLIEYVYEIFHEAGISKEEIPLAASLFHNFVISFVLDEIAIKNQTNSSNTLFHDEIPVKDFPLFMELTFSSKILDMDYNFQFGLQVLIEGFKSKINAESHH